MPAGSDGRRTTARAKGKVERPFRTVKDAHETLYHFHEPETEAEANRWLARFIATYNRARSPVRAAFTHRRLAGAPARRRRPADVRLGAVLRLRARAGAAPGRHRLPPDRRGVAYEVDAELAGETVVVWWGLFDQELWVEHGEERMRPFRSDRAARSRCIATASTAKRAMRSAPTRWRPRGKLALPRAALSGENPPWS